MPAAPSTPSKKHIKRAPLPHTQRIKCPRCRTGLRVEWAGSVPGRVLTRNEAVREIQKFAYRPVHIGRAGL